MLEFKRFDCLVLPSVLTTLLLQFTLRYTPPFHPQARIASLLLPPSVLRTQTVWSSFSSWPGTLCTYSKIKSELLWVGFCFSSRRKDPTVESQVRAFWSAAGTCDFIIQSRFWTFTSTCYFGCCLLMRFSWRCFSWWV